MSNIRFIKIVSRLILKGFFPVVYPFLIWPDISLNHCCVHFYIP